MSTFEGFYLGSMADLDSYEGDFISENSSDLVGLTFGSSGTPLYDSIDTLSFQDLSGDGIIYDNDVSDDGDYISYSGTASELDSTIGASVTITYSDGTTATADITILQDVSGRVFLVPRLTGDTNNDVLDDHPIVSIQIDSITNDNFGGLYANVESNAFITCFTASTLIATKQGVMNIAQLVVGDKVCTMDHGYQPIRWIGARRVRATGDFAPIRIKAGALGQGVPTRDLRVSPQHRILVRSKIAQRMFGCFEVLLAAKKLTGMPGITVDQTARHVTYWHFLFDHHEIVFSEGAATESFYTGPQAMKALDQKSQAEIFALFPDLAQMTGPPTPARLIVQGKRQNRLLERHRKHHRLIYQDHPDDLDAAALT